MLLTYVFRYLPQSCFSNSNTTWNQLPRLKCNCPYTLSKLPLYTGSIGPKEKQKTKQTVSRKNKPSTSAIKFIPKPPEKPKYLVEIEPFYDEYLAPPENRVSAYHVNAGFDLLGLRNSLREKNCKTAEKENFLLTESSTYFGQHSCSALFFKNGCVVFWNMSIYTEKKFLEIARSFEKCYAEDSVDRLFVGETEEMEVTDNESITTLDETGIKLTKSLLRTTDRVSISLALMTTVRLNFLEKKIEHQLQLERHKIEGLVDRMPTWNLDSLGKILFQSITRLHQLRYELNIEQGLLAIPDSLWEFEEQCKLFSQIQKLFDFRLRIDQLNARLSLTFNYFDTISDYVDEKHSSRLEKIIIVLILLELIVALSEVFYRFKPKWEGFERY